MLACKKSPFSQLYFYIANRFNINTTSIPLISSFSVYISHFPFFRTESKSRNLRDSHLLFFEARYLILREQYFSSLRRYSKYMSCIRSAEQESKRMNAPAFISDGIPHPMTEVRWGGVDRGVVCLRVGWYGNGMG